jgi:hypothetical protein
MEPNKEHIELIEKNHMLKCTALVDDGSAYFVPTIGPPQTPMRLTKGKIKKLAELVAPPSLRP